MSAYDILCNKIEQAGRDAKLLLWRYRGPGYGQNIAHVIGLIEPHQVVTASASHGWLGTPEDFIAQFSLVAT